MADLYEEELFKKAIETYGEDAQMIVAMEEMGELIQALSRYLVDKPSNVEEEIADVLIMLNQLKLLFDNKEIRKFYKKKLKRLEKNLI
jgi:NTP pyrophosphatase (non-canonical NTP hydrolase)